MQKLVQGVRRFQDSVFQDYQVIFERLRSGQRPQTLFITCSDSRVVPGLLTQTNPGDLFVLRSAGNVVPHYEADGKSSDRAAEATIEYAVEELQVRDVIICGHSHCGAMGAILHPNQAARPPAMQRHLATVSVHYRLAELDRDGVNDPASRLHAIVEENVLVQMANLATHPSVIQARAKAQLNVHGWIYHFESGRVDSYCKTRSKFVPLSTWQAQTSSKQQQAA